MFDLVKNIHIVVDISFLLLLIIKMIAWFQSEELLDKIRAKTKIVEMVLGTLIIVSGVYLTILVGISNVGGWFHLKLTLLFIAIPLAIVSFLKKKRTLALISIIIFLYILALAWTKSVSIF